MNKKIHIITMSVVILAVAGGFFYGGMIFGKNQTPKFPAGNFQALRGNRTGGTSGIGNFISGDIVSADSTSITLQLPNGGGSKIIFYSATTQINKQATGTSADLTAGTSVSVTGTTNSDGTVTAQSIQLRPKK